METIFYHGSNTIIQKPDLSKSREDIDFGVGFYLTADYNMAAKWACKKNNSICNRYNLNMEGLSVHTFELDREWLDYVIANRNEEIDKNNKFSKYDVLIGAIADDRLYNTIEMYESGFIPAFKAIEIMNCMGYGQQIVLKTEKAIGNLELLDFERIKGEKKQEFKELYKNERKESIARTEQLIKEYQDQRDQER